MTVKVLKKKVVYWLQTCLLFNIINLGFRFLISGFQRLQRKRRRKSLNRLGFLLSACCGDADVNADVKR